MDILSALDAIVDAAKDSKLSEEFYKKCSKYIKYVCSKLEYIDTRLAVLAIPAEFNYDVREYEALIQCASSHKDAGERLKWRFGFGSREAEFLLGLSIEEKKTYFIQKNCEAEIAKWEKLKEVLVQ